MFLAGWWVAGWRASPSAVKSALVVWGTYAVVDGAIIVASGALGAIAGIVALSYATKLAAIYSGAVLRSRRAHPLD
jgi:hypothetical protein